MSMKPSTGRVRSAYEFIKADRDQHSAQTMCRVLIVAPSGYYRAPHARSQPSRAPRVSHAALVRGEAVGPDSQSSETTVHSYKAKYGLGSGA